MNFREEYADVPYIHTFMPTKKLSKLTKVHKFDVIKWQFQAYITNNSTIPFEFDQLKIKDLQLMNLSNEDFEVGKASQTCKYVHILPSYSPFPNEIENVDFIKQIVTHFKNVEVIEYDMSGFTIERFRNMIDFYTSI